MGSEVGEVAAGAATVDARPVAAWRERLVVAFGGAVVALACLVMAGSWTDGLRDSTFVQLRQDLSDGVVREWYAADSLSRGTFDRMEAHQSPVAAPTDGVETGATEDGSSDSEQGGILVWRAWGATGWKVAAHDTRLGSFSSFGTSGDLPEVAELVRQLRAADVPMRPMPSGPEEPLPFMAVFVATALFVGLVVGPAPRVGTRWFWFFAMVSGPLVLGFVAYAVTELIGVRRAADPPPAKRLPGVAGLVGGALLSLVLALTADFLRSRGVPLPL